MSFHPEHHSVQKKIYQKKKEQTELRQRERNTTMSIWFQATGQLEQPIPEPQERDN